MVQTFQRGSTMIKATAKCTAISAALFVMTLLSGSETIVAAEKRAAAYAPATSNYSPSTTQFMPLGVGKSVVVDLPGDIKDVLVADPKIANAVVRTSRRAYIIGVAIGQTNVYFFDADGKQLMGLDIAVTRDLNGIRAALKRALPAADIAVEGLADGVYLSGSVATPVDSQQAFDLAVRLAGDSKVVNGLTVRGRDQVMLKVTVAEVQRDVVKQLGINLSGSFGYGTAVVNFNNTNPFAGAGPISSSAIAPTIPTATGSVTATLRALERANVIRTLAEPNLTAISGESASFLAGGEFPVPTGSSCEQGGINCRGTIEFKKFGVSLNFTPVVLSEGRISLKVVTEVSELSDEGAIAQQGLNIPSLKTRRADTTVDIPSGGALALAGMIQEQTKQQIHGMPGLMNLPVLGALFKSRDYINRQTELMILVTPYVVRAVSQKDLAKPDDGFANASDPTANLLGRFNRLYGVPGQLDQRHKNYRGSYGFILN
jgi:pilus assembly protein CpaC